MQSKPEDYRTYFAETFKDHRVVDAYRHRPPYPVILPHTEMEPDIADMLQALKYL